MPATDQEVFEHFHTDYPGTSRAVALLAYARYAQAKYEWIKQKHTIGSIAPTERDITRWISELPNSRLEEIHAGVLRFFEAAAEALFVDRIDQERARAIEQSIVGRVDAMATRVERATSFWRTIGPNVIVAVVGSFVFALIIILASLVVTHDPSPFAWLKERSSAVQTSPAR